MPDITSLESLTHESFAPACGERFLLAIPEGDDRLELTLLDVATNGMRGARGREQFAVHFLGPRDPVLPQMIYRLENPRMGILEIFLVPVARHESGVTYEAIFT